MQGVLHALKATGEIQIKCLNLTGNEVLNDLGAATLKNNLLSFSFCRLG